MLMLTSTSAALSNHRPKTFQVKCCREGEAVRVTFRDVLASIHIELAFTVTENRAVQNAMKKRTAESLNDSFI